MYLKSLTTYISIQELITKVKKEQSKQVDIGYKDELIKKAEDWYEKIILILNTEVYGIFCSNFKRSIEKVKFILG